MIIIFSIIFIVAVLTIKSQKLFHADYKINAIKNFYFGFYTVVLMFVQVIVQLIAGTMLIELSVLIGLNLFSLFLLYRYSILRSRIGIIISQLFISIYFILSYATITTDNTNMLMTNIFGIAAIAILIVVVCKSKLSCGTKNRTIA